MISTRLTKLAKYSKALSSSRFLPSLPLYFRRQSSTFAPLLTTSFLFLSFIPLFFFIFSSLMCVCVFFFFSLPRPSHPDCVRVVRGSFQFPLLRVTSDFEVSSISTRCFHSRSLFFFRRFFPGLRTYYFLCLFLVLRAPPFDLDGERRRYLQRSWSEGILNVCGGNLRFDLFLSGDIFVILLLILRGLFLS